MKLFLFDAIMTAYTCAFFSVESWNHTGWKAWTLMGLAIVSGLVSGIATLKVFQKINQALDKQSDHK